ncbi:MAG: MFS multidrug transporter [Lasallia pustulata]|uniref:MFS multidrug transporter n=1 Tax=Lasallia pustulata TaxID=136370 RepID=A0A5M8Q000_9LECA|nr:MAG: MFS multidrug transporter [Lasallia pustulata]
MDDKRAQVLHEQFRAEIESLGLAVTGDGYVRWDKQSPAHPRNWTARRKAYDIGVIIFLEFFTTAISTAGTPASEQARYEYGIGRTFAIFSFTSMYLLGQCLGAVLFPSYSETFGRKPLYTLSSILYCIFCVMIADVPNFAAVVIGRFITGVLSSVPTVIIAGSIEDMFDTEDRIWMVFLWAVIANLGLVLGPITSTYITYSFGWRWVFHIAAIVMTVVFVLSLGIKESRPSLLLERRVAILRKSTGNISFRIRNPDYVPDFKSFIHSSLIRPLHLLFTEPIVFLVTIMSAVTFGVIYFFAEALPVVYSSFGFTERQASLAFIPIGIGLGGGVFIRLYDRRVLQRRRQQNKPLEPEDKLVGFAIAAPVLAISLWFFAWTVPPLVPHVHWLVSMSALVLAGFAANEFDCTLAGYLSDSYTIYAASAYAGLSLLRTFACAAFPLFAHEMYAGLGSNVASSILATVATVFCICPFVFLKYGKRIREASQFARYSLAVYRDNRLEENGDEVDEVGRQMEDASRVVSLGKDDGAGSLDEAAGVVPLADTFRTVSMEEGEGVMPMAGKSG